jgi:hypothetical protein
VNGLRVAANVAALVVFPAVLVGSLTFAALEYASRRITDRRLPDVADEAESWLRALYQEDPA